MNIQIKNVESPDEWENFINNYKPHTFLQCWEWAEVNEQRGDKVFRLGIYEDYKLVGVALIIKEVARRGSFLLCPHGPLLDWNNFEHFKLLTNYLKNLAKKEKVNFVRINSLAIKNEKNIEIFKKLGYKNAPIHVHAELVWMLDLSPTEDELLANMRKNTRYAIKKAKKDD